MAASRRDPNPSNVNHKRNQPKSRFNKRNDPRSEKESGSKKSWDLLRTIVVVCLAVTVSFMQRNHVANMFESDRHFSHLSELERELAFRTEMGLYYSYFKTIITAKTSLEGLHAIMYDNITEYPSTINTLKRFNLYPEVTLGLAFRVYDWLSNVMGWQNKICYTVNRGEGYEPVQSCEGLGEPAYFYVESVFLLNGLMMGVFFLFGVFLSYETDVSGSNQSCLLGCPFGGVITVACYFFNHGECTRVQWTPPLRESFGYPFFVLQMLVVSYMLRKGKMAYVSVAALAGLTTIFMLCWQFAQFALLTQLVSVFGTYVLQYTDTRTLKLILTGHTIGFLTGYLFLYGNEMLLTSYFASCLCTVWVIVLLDPVIKKLKFKLIVWAAEVVLLVTGTLSIKVLISKLLRVADDAHIGEIFLSKFTDFNNFHTLMYTCAKEFDFIEMESFEKLMKSLLIPSAAFVVCLVIFQVLKYEFSLLWHKEKPTETQNDVTPPSRLGAEVVYNTLQLLAFTVMAILIMRLKLFWTPHMCIVASLLASRKLFSWVPRYNEVAHSAVLVGLLACMSVAGYANLQHQWSIKGEFSNYPLEELVEWIKAKTPRDAVFAGPMPTMATVKLCTLRPIVNHPHYEDAGLRERTKKVYSMFSRKPASEVKQNLINLGVNYAILENSWCVRKTREGCAMPEIWDVEDEKNRGKEPTCTLLRRDPQPHFTRVFRNSVYDVLKVK